jgi:hypothetical protein
MASFLSSYRFKSAISVKFKGHQFYLAIDHQSGIDNAEEGSLVLVVTACHNDHLTYCCKSGNPPVLRFESWIGLGIWVMFNSNLT